MLKKKKSLNFNRGLIELIKKVIYFACAALTALTPVIFIIIGLTLTYKDLAFMNNSVEAVGVIVDYKAYKSNSIKGTSGVTLAPIFEFKTAEGEVVRAVSPVAYGKKLEIDTAKIRYNINNPKNIRIIGKNRLIYSLLITCIGIISAIAVFNLKVFNRRSIKQMLSSYRSGGWLGFQQYH
jgi:hypothetical protein